MYEFPETFLPRRISRAADLEMAAVLEEDAVLRQHEAAARAARMQQQAGRRQATR